MKKLKSLFLALLIIPLSSCAKEIKRNSFYFDTYCETRLYEGNDKDLTKINQIFAKIDKLTDNFKDRDLNNVYKINNTNEEVEIDSDLYELLSLTFSSNLSSLNYFNPLCGSLSKAWKEALSNKTILDEDTISSELAKINKSSLELLGQNKVRRNGEAEIDLGAIAKGFALDKVKNYLDEQNYKKYLIDAGSSSILLGEKSGGKNFKIKILDLTDSYILAKNCFVSTSSYSRQGVEINGISYSHIINPLDGSAINENDTVIVLSESGYLGDILSTAFINESIDSIKELETSFNVRSLVIKNNEIIYKNNEIEVVNK